MATTDLKDAPEAEAEPRVWYRYSVREIRFVTGYTLSEEPVARRDDLMAAVRQMAEDFAYRETHRPDGWSAKRISMWVRHTIDLFEDALESSDFRRFESSPMGKHTPVGIIVEDTA